MKDNKPTYEELENQIAELKKQIEKLHLKSLTHEDEKDKQIIDLIDNNAKVEKNELFIQTILNNVQYSNICLLDRDLRILVTGGSEYAKYGFCPEKFKNKHLSEILSKQVFEINKTYINKAFQGELSSYVIEYNGDYFMNYVSPFTFESTKINYVLLTINKITELKKAEIELKAAKEKVEENEQRLNLAAVSGQLGIWDWNVNENIMIWNERMFDLYGINHETFPNNFDAWINSLHPEDKQFAMDECNAALNGEKVFDTSFRVVHPNGKIIYIKANATVIKNSSNDSLRMIGINRDITNYRLAEIEILKSKKAAEEREFFLRESQKAGNIGSYKTDFISGYWQSSETLDNIFGIDKNYERTIKGWLDIVHQDETNLLNDYLIEISKKKLNFDRVYRIVRINDKQTRWVHGYGINMFDSADNLTEMIGTIQDITEHKIFELELQNAKEKAEESDRLKTAFLQNMSHEIRTPLNAISGFSEILYKPDLSEEKRKSFITIIQNSSKQLISIVSDILTISSLETKQEKINIDKVCINDIIVELLTIFKQQALKQNISLYAKQQLNNKQSEIYTDKTKITQILTNILTNALKFTHEGFIEFGYNLKDNEMEFYVKDSGIGIKPEFHEKIFERFHQAYISKKILYGGTGLGLAISKAFSELLGGKIWVQSELEKGSTFYFTIPYKPVNEIDITTSTTKQNENPIIILVAEDDEYNFLFIEELLIDMDLKLIHAKDGRETVEIFKSNPNIDLILLDIKMPIMTGHEAAKIIKELKPELPIVAQSAYALAHERAKFEGIFDDYLTKPINKNELKQIIRKYIEI